MAELLARVRSKIERPPVPSDHLRHDRQTNVMSEQAFWEIAEREIDRAVRSGRAGSVACIAVDEWPRIQERLGSRALAELAKQIAIVLLADAQPLDVIGRAGTGAFLLLLPESDDRAAKRRLDQIAQQIVDRTFVAGGERVRLTPIVGYLEFATESNINDARRQVFVALEFAELHLDLQAVRYARSMDAVVERARSERRRRFPTIRTRFRTPFQIGIVLLIGLVLPFLIYGAADRAGYNLAGPMYIVVVVALLTTAFLIWVEGLAALRPIQPPAEPGAPYRPASAIIAAYLPNEAATIMETVEAFRRIDYPAPLQIILAYNTPKDHPVEEALRRVAAEDDRFVPLRVQRSTSKAQNVNAALAETTGEIVGVFDAYHQPAPDSFRRAWQWLSNGYDVVQGHCVVRNGGETWVS
jgi:GGDEF domain-containing protein